MKRTEPCPHAETTTLLWLYGEGPEEHVHHVTTCEECTQVARLHADVAAVVRPVADDLAEVPPSVVIEPTPLPEPANRGWVVGVLAGLAAAAAVLLGLFGAFGLPGASPSPGPVARPEPSIQAPAPPAPDAAPVPNAAPAPDVTPAEPHRELALDVPTSDTLDQVDAELLITTPTPSAPSPEDERLAEALFDQAFSAELDGDLQALHDEFEALEAGLTTL